ncbi:protein serine/threonine phosphatase 2C [Dacryopinax primogenitus]|uniref:Protein serine/threonine phosphatase 2C n=1 Tax=Dacryopinax primogenitus (strain DJM 731) TaxID=1858805 RepID=M5FRW5_DACPD|nr:protein serine/threonine phosphatase 2C [Dacryopinax primogenitus]EJT97809.1 protein serine/threonine phosphatase 2C [Dacryopinax primogenitus]
MPLVPRCLRLSTTSSIPLRRYHDYLKVATPDGRYARVPLSNPKVIGAYSIRGTRSHQEDAYAAYAIHVPPDEIRSSLEKNYGMVWDPGTLPLVKDGQLLWVGIYDGHGGALVSRYLQHHLHEIFESVQPSDIEPAVQWLKSQGGYFRRWRGGLLQPYVANPSHTPPLRLEQRAELAFIEADRSLAPNAVNCGSTVSVALLRSEKPVGAPFWDAEELELTVAHCGDTRVLLASTEGGKVTPMTEHHHAEMPRESARLLRMGSGLVTDSFGEARWMGALANTRGLGDGRYKPFGVTPEPDMKHLHLHGPSWSHLVLVSDGVGSIASDQEIVDLARSALDPSAAARAIVGYVEDLGGEDNATAVVVPLPGWGRVRGEDMTRELRRYRREEAIGSERQRRM